MRRLLVGAAAALVLGGCAVDVDAPPAADSSTGGTEGATGPPLAAPAADAPPGAAPLAWPSCGPGQVRVLIFGTFHFVQPGSSLDITTPGLQRELAGVLDGLAAFEPARVAVEFPYARREMLQAAYREYIERDPDSVRTANEIGQVGFRLARRLGHDSVFPVDVPMNLWHDSIQVFDERWPPARDSLRARWRAPVLRGHSRDSDSTLSGILRRHNTDLPPRNREMYAGFLPLVKEDVYAGALKLRPWYDRNLRIVQNLFRVTEPGEERLLLVIGSGHLRVLKQIMEMTPQLCPVSALPYLEQAG